MPITKPTRCRQPTQEERDEHTKRDMNAPWVGGPHFVWNKAGGQYKPRTGNSNGVRKPKRSKKGSKDQPRSAPVTPRWGRKYAAAE